MLVGRDAEMEALVAVLAAPGLVVVAGPPGIGKTALVRAAGLPLLETGALATLRHLPGLPLTRALRAPVPPDDVPLAAEAVRARLRDRVLLVDDAQWADGYTLAVLAAVAPVARLVVTLRTPSVLGARLRELASLWLELPGLAAADAARLCADPAVLARAGGNPLALTVLAGSAAPDSPLAYAAATLVAELPVEARTALAALGLLGRPAPAGLLGPGAAALVAGGVVVEGAAGLAAREPYLAEVAAGVLPAAERAAMHARLGGVLPDGVEAARHLIAAGEPAAAAARARQAAAAAGTAGERAAALLLGFSVEPGLAVETAIACAAAGLPVEVLRILAEAEAGTGSASGGGVRGAAVGFAVGGGAWRGAAGGPAGGLAAGRPTGVLAGGAGLRVEVAALRAGALIELGRPAEAEAELRAVDGDLATVPGPVAARHAVAAVRAVLGSDPETAWARVEYAVAQFGADAPPALLAVRADVLRAARRPGWDDAARTAMEAAAAAGDRVAERLAGAALVAGLRDALRVGEAGDLASELAAAAAADGAYSAELGFRAEALWAELHADGAVDDVIRTAGGLVDRTAPAAARALLLATLALAHADAGGLPTARALLGRAGIAGRDRTVRWVAAETAWLDGDPAAAERITAGLRGADLPAGLAELTALWAHRDAGGPEPDGSAEEPGPPPVDITVRALRHPADGGLPAAAAAWGGVMAREQVRCLLAAGALEPLLEAERLAEAAGLAALLGRVRRELRAHGVTRRPTVRAGELSPREREVLALVGDGLSTRRIAELLGVTRHTAETYVKSGMAKLGARTRTEAAVLAAALATPVTA